MTPLPLQLAAWKFWSPSGRDPVSWLQGEDEGDTSTAAAAPVSAIAPLQRRRMSRLTRMALEVATEISDAADYFVFCSRHGEIQRTASILDDLARGIEPSPTDFAMSVHNTSAGLYSVARQFRAPSTSLCAGELTFIAGWIEAGAWLSAHSGHSVLLVMFDERLPPLLRGDVPHSTRDYAMALLLSGGDAGILLETGGDSRGPTHTIGPHFLSWCLSGKREFNVSVEGQGWRWRRDD